MLHVYSESVQIPQGAVRRRELDPATLSFAGLRLAATIDKQAFVQRYFREREYGRLLAKQIRAFRPDVVISSSTPLDAQRAAIKASRDVDARFLFWLQDIQGVAIERLLGARLNGFGRVVGRYYTGMEKQLLRESDAIVSITEDFNPTLNAWGISSDAVHLIPNWAPLEELPVMPKRNEWAREHGLEDKAVFLYSGTLGLKHNPELLLRLALAHRDQPEVAVVVVTEGAKAEWLKAQKASLGLTGLHVLPFQPYSSVPNVLATADVLVGVLDPDASAFSVPSKVLAYHCAARPILLSVPSENLAARIVARARSGIVVEPGDAEAFVAQAQRLLSSPSLRAEMAANARRYAEATFDLERITDRFESLFNSIVAQVPAEELEDEPAQAL